MELTWKGWLAVGVAFALVIFGIMFGLKQAGVNLDKLAPTPKAKVVKTLKVEGTNTKIPVVNIGVVTWGGYAGGEFYNEGFAASTESRFYKEYGFAANYILLDDFDASRSAWKNGEVDLLWITADAFGTEVGNLMAAGFDPRIIMQPDWSRGGDVAVGIRSIKTVQDLRGKSVAVAFGTPSETFLLWMLESAGMSYADINVVQAPSAIDAAAYFKAGKVPVAIVWSPDDEGCIQAVPGAHVLKSTKEATHIIPDVFYAKESWLNSHLEMATHLVEGSLIGAAEINSSEAAKRKAAKILAEGLSQPEDFCYKAINNVRLCTYGDNVNFFNLNGDYHGVTGEDVYLKSGRLFQKIGRAPANLPDWRSVVDTRPLRGVKLTATGANAAEGQMHFAVATAAERNAPAFSSKSAAINFATGSAQLDENARTIVDMQFADLSTRFQGARIRVVGHTDDVGDHDMNVRLSLLRAQATVDYLVQQYRFDANRFIVEGKGPDEPAASNATDVGRAKNRRVEFEIL